MAGYIEKLGNGSLLFKNGWDLIVFVEKWVGVCHFCKKIGGSGSLFLKIGGSGLFLLKNGWERVVFVEKWVRVDESG